MAQSGKLFQPYKALHGVDDPNEISFETAYTAAEKGDLFVVERWVRSNRDQINQLLPSSGYSLLHAASAKGKTNIVDFLISQNANINLESTTINTEYFTPLQLACKSGHQEAVEHLVAAKALINQSGAQWKSAIHHALLSEKPEDEMVGIINCLLNNGINLAQEAYWNSTASYPDNLLIFAARANKFKLKKLVSEKIDQAAFLPQKYAQLEQDFKQLQLTVQTLAEENRTLKAAVEKLLNPKPAQPHIVEFADFDLAPRSRKP